VPATVVDAVQTPLPCACRCHEVLSPGERAAGFAGGNAGRNDLCVSGLCVCGMRKWKQCCGAVVAD
jgi:hypothetical protein